MNPRIWAISRLIAVHKHGVLYYVLGDHLGSTQRVTDASGNVVDSIGYTVYGETRSGGSSLPMDKRFTGQILDISTGLYWYASRPYNPVLCRFVQADTIAPDYNNPQSLNRYSYGYNNPVKYVDPTGHDAEDWLDDSWKAEFQAAHEGADPTADDYVYRFVSMAIASGMGGDGGGGEGGGGDGGGFSPGNFGSGLPGVSATGVLPGSTTLGSPITLGAYGGDGGSATYISWDAGALVLNNVPEPLASLINLPAGGSPNAITLSGNLIVSSYDVSASPAIMRHEEGHLLQATILGGAYLPAYLGMAAAAALLNSGNPYTKHPMEIWANRSAGYADNWHVNH